jgi:flagellar motility protein MotE (MotC chaperone)
MIKNIRILPVMVFALVLIFGLKLSTVWTDAQVFFVKNAIAEEQTKTASDPVATDENNTEPENALEPDAVAAEAKPVVAAHSVPETQFSDSEIEVLERLVERRSELDRRNQELDMRDNLLKATEARIDDKISKLKDMEATLNKLLQLHDDQEKTQLESLVKIYEKMKPKDAARIFNSLEMEILINVASRIKEAKMAVILASMNNQRANKLTVELATRRQLPGVSDKKS